MRRLPRSSTFRARALRRSATLAERRLWEILRDRRCEGAKFRRQQPLGPFIVDFFCTEARLAIEADGASHFPPSRRQIARDTVLELAGIAVLRFENREILSNPSAVTAKIRKALKGRRFRAS